jgi:hypothetical protein
MICLQSASTAASSSAAGTTSLTMPASRALRADHRGRPDEICHRLARHAIDQRRHHHRRHDVVRHLRHLKLGRIGGEGDVADRGNGAAEAEGASAHHADHGDFAAAERAVTVEDYVVAAAQLQCFRRCARRAFAHGLAADAEILAGAAQDDDLGGLGGAEQELGQFHRHGIGGGVADLWPIERDFQHRSLAGGDNVAGHAWSS